MFHLLSTTLHNCLHTSRFFSYGVNNRPFSSCKLMEKKNLLVKQNHLNFLQTEKENMKYNIHYRDKLLLQLRNASLSVRASCSGDVVSSQAGLKT